MDYLDNYKDHKRVSDIHNFCKKYSIRDYTINDDYTVDVDNNVYLYRCDLSSIPIQFGRVNGFFNISYNNLKSLEGSPSYVEGEFHCSSNELKTLKDGPKFVGGNYVAGNNINMDKLEISDVTVKKMFSISGCNIRDFIGFPKCRTIFISPNPIINIWLLFNDVNYIELFNDYDIIRDGKDIILYRLNAFLDDIGKPRPDEYFLTYISDYKYNIIE